MAKLLKLALLAAVVVLCPLAGLALPATYHVVVNTTSLAGTTGGLDFQFNPGPLVTQVASVQVLNFSTDGTAGTVTPTGSDTTGSIPTGITLDNKTAFNDLFSVFSFSSKLSFDISLFGSALSTPNGTATSGSILAFSLFSDPAGSIPTLTSDLTNGFGYTVKVNLDGTTTPTSYLTNVSPTGPTPEPSSLILLATAAALGAGTLRERYLLTRSR